MTIAPYKIQNNYECRFVPKHLIGELINLYHLARVPLSGASDRSKYAQMIWASGEFSKAHPEVSATAAYKDLDGLLK